MKLNLKEKITGFIKVRQCKKRKEIPRVHVLETLAFTLPFLFVFVLAVLTFVLNSSDDVPSHDNKSSDDFLNGGLSVDDESDFRADDFTLLDDQNKTQFECIPVEIVTLEDESFNFENYEFCPSK